MKVASGNVLWKQRKRNWCRTPFTFTVYTPTDREMNVKTGVLNERFNLIKLFRIVDTSVERTFLQRPDGPAPQAPGFDGGFGDFDAEGFADVQ